MMLVTPYYLLRVGGAYNVEKLSDFSWTFMGYGVMILYHFLILMPIAVVSRRTQNPIIQVEKP